jgi:hypothetical protein
MRIKLNKHHWKMKKIYLFSALSLFLFSCEDKDDPIQNQEEAVFRISYTQQGDLEGFTRIFTYDTNLPSSEDFVWFESKKPAPAYLDTDSLTGNSYIIETKLPVKEISLNVTLGWIPTRARKDGWQGPDQCHIACQNGDTILVKLRRHHHYGTSCRMSNQDNLFQIKLLDNSYYILSKGSH